MSGTGDTMRPTLVSCLGSRDETSTRDKLAERLRRMEASAPEALDLFARALDAMADPLRGVATQVAGPKGGDHFRRVIRGEEAGVAEELARLAVDPRKEPRAAVLAFLCVLADAIGYHLEAKPITTAVEIHEAIAARRVADATLDAEIMRDLKDGQLDDDHDLDLAEAEARLLKLRAAIAQAKAESIRRRGPKGAGR